MTKSAPATDSHRLTAFKNGKATSRAPICWGMTMFIRPERNGMAIKRIMMVPWAENTWLKWSGGKKPGDAPTAMACWARIMMASEKPRSSMISDKMMYMMPIFLWSTLVSHSHQRYGHFFR